jgi:hypothetical protein
MYILSDVTKKTTNSASFQRELNNAQLERIIIRMGMVKEREQDSRHFLTPTRPSRHRPLDTNIRRRRHKSAMSIVMGGEYMISQSWGMGV